LLDVLRSGRASTAPWMFSGPLLSIADAADRRQGDTDRIVQYSALGVPIYKSRVG